MWSEQRYDVYNDTSGVNVVIILIDSLLKVDDNGRIPVVRTSPTIVPGITI